jgi:hypothetical protein
MILGVVGKKQSGKTTLAKVAEAAGFSSIAFADPLKDIIEHVYDIPKSILNDPIAKEQYQLTIQISQRDLYSILMYADTKYAPVPVAALLAAVENFQCPFISNPRQLLQVVGTDLFRNHIDKDYWINSFLKLVEPNKNYIIHDVRFENELNVIKNKLLGKILVIERPGTDVDDHVSESFVPAKDQYDYKLFNNLSLNEFQKDCTKLVETLKKEYQWDEAQKTKTKPNISGAS